MNTILYGWDEVSLSIVIFSVDERTVEGKPPIDAIFAADREISDDLGSEGYGQEAESLGDGTVRLRGKFGRQMRYHLYWHPRDDRLAKATAEADLDKEIGE